MRTVIRDPELLEQIRKNGYSKDNMTYQEAMIAGIVYKAICGNTQAYTAVKDTVEPPCADTGAEAVMEKLDSILDDIGRSASDDTAAEFTDGDEVK